MSVFINPALSELDEGGDGGGGGGGGGENVAEQPLVYTDQGRLDRTKFGNHITQLGASAHTVVCVYDVMLILLRQLRLRSAAVITSIY